MKRFWRLYIYIYIYIYILLSALMLSQTLYFVQVDHPTSFSVCLQIISVVQGKKALTTKVGSPSFLRCDRVYVRVLRQVQGLDRREKNNSTTLLLF